MINKQNNEKENVMNNIVVRVEKSGNRFNAFDVDNVKYTSQITTGARKKAYNNAESAPLERLCALIKAVFSSTVCNRKLVGVWYAFWSDSRSRLLYKDLCGKQDIAYTSYLLKQCQSLEATVLSTMGANDAALSIESMISGLWQELLIGSPDFKQKEAVSIVFKLLQLIYPDRCHEIKRLEKET